jgi:glutamate racemase
VPHGRDRPIGVFDSGVGGLSVLRALRAELPGEDFVYFSDTATRLTARRRTPRRFVQHGHVGPLAGDRGRPAGAAPHQGLVVACNTATAAAVHLLRAQHTHPLPVVGVEPAPRASPARRP